MKVIAVGNNKGGVGKTTVSIILATLLNKRGRKTLFIDADPQRNSTRFYSNNQIPTNMTLYDVFAGNDAGTLKVSDVIRETELGDYVASYKDLKNVNPILSGNVDLSFKLYEDLKELSGKYEFVVIDTGLEMDKISEACLIASDEVLITATADDYSMEGVDNYIPFIERTAKRLNPNLKINGILLSMFESNTNFGRAAKEYYAGLAKEKGFHFYESCPRRSIAIKTAQNQHQDIETYDAKNGVVQEYVAFVEEFLKLEKKAGGKK